MAASAQKGEASASPDLWDKFWQRYASCNFYPNVPYETSPDYRATRLLFDHLTDAQRMEAIKEGYFTVWVGRIVKKQFRFWLHLPVPQQRSDRDSWQSFCIHPYSGSYSRPYPRADIQLAHKLLLESDYTKWRRTANPK